jgi:O-antigen ligase
VSDVAGRAGGAAAAAVLAATAAVLVVYSQVALVAVASVAAVVVLFAAGAVLRTHVRARPRPAALEAPAADEASELRLPRALFYVGILFVGQLTLRPAFGLTLSDWLFLASLGTTVAVLAVSRRSLWAPLPGLVVIGAVLFSIGAVVSSYTADDWVASLAVLIRFVYLTLLWFWLAMILLRSVRHVAIAVVLWVTSAAVTGAGALLQLAAGDVIPGGDVAHGRMTGFTEHVNDLGGVTAIALVPAVALAVRLAHGHRAVAGATVLLVCVAIGLMLSGSVGGGVAALAGVAIWLAIGGASKRAFAVFAVGAAVLMLAVSYQSDAGSPSFRERVVAVTADPALEQSTFWSRLDSFRAAWDSISANPLVGVGLDAESTRLPEFGEQVHNMLLLQWHAAGLLGVAGLVLILLGIFGRGLAVARGAPGALQLALATALLASFVSFVTFGMGAPMTYKRYGWLSAALILALAHASSSRRAGAGDLAYGRPAAE